MKDLHFKTPLGQIIVGFRNKPANLKKREFEKIEIHRILNLFEITDDKLSYGKNGNPIVSTEGKHLSFSHSKGWFAVYLGNSILGIDIQTFHKNITQGKSYFININEECWHSDFELHLVWAAKEAIFKKYIGVMSDLAKDVTITEIKYDKNQIFGFYKKELIELRFKKIEDVILVFTIN